jgi:aerobic-type carbon monoxide dehydrogenase small subunit (CoxS/CutS family)
MDEKFDFKLNGRSVRVTADGTRMLLGVLRYDLGIKGVKYGCGEGFCGACTVLVDDQAVRSCRTPLKDVKGKNVVTIEGLAHDEDLHPLQKAFMKHDALQCGYCTPGMILNAYGLLRRDPNPTKAKIIDEMSGNLCRCGTYARIVEAIQDAAREMRGEK